MSSDLTSEIPFTVFVDKLHFIYVKYTHRLLLLPIFIIFWQERLKIIKKVTQPNPNLPTPIRIRLKQLCNTIPNQLSTFSIQLSTLTNDPTLQL